jgi:hypothetical protein
MKRGYLFTAFMLPFIGNEGKADAEGPGMHPMDMNSGMPTQ